MQQTGSRLGLDLLGKYKLARDGAWHGMMPSAATSCQGLRSLAGRKFRLAKGLSSQQLLF